MESHGFCVICGKLVLILNPLNTRIRNRKSRNGTIEAHKGSCPHCKNVVYKIIGH